MKHLLSCFFIVFSIQIAKAQEIVLPYYTGFDTEEEQAGWVQYEMADTFLYNWSFGYGGYSSPRAISHSYAPASDVIIGDNWMVSPSFSISNGGILDSVRYKFSGFSTPQEGDTIAIYLLNGSQNPALASSKILLFDFRGDVYTNDYKYHIKTNISLPPLDGKSYLAIRYRNNEWSSNWLTVAFDNISISDPTVGIQDEITNSSEIKVFPNPSNGIFTIQSPKTIQSVKVHNECGETIYPNNFIQNDITKLDLSNYPKGMYIISIELENKIVIQKVIIE